jgi:hypothetical protein
MEGRKAITKVLEQDQEALLGVLKRYEEELRGYAGIHYMDVNLIRFYGSPAG